MTNQDFIIKALIEMELDDANKKFPHFASPHEGYAVIKEEVEEAEDASRNINTYLDILWSLVKSKDYAPNDYLGAVDKIEDWAVEQAKEAIQVAAMAKKFKKIIR